MGGTGSTGEQVMPVYIVGFDVRNSSSTDHYSGLQNAVAKLERHRLMPWLYLVAVPFTAGALKEYLLNHMAEEDRLWISKLPPKARFEFAYQTTGGTSSWLKKHSRIEIPGQSGIVHARDRSPSEDMIHQRPNVAEMHRRDAIHAANS
jgi:hypothetical protein